MIKTLSPSHLAIGPLLRKYFRSGWAFLIPYLAAYLLYWALRWPVNPTASEGGVKVASESGSLTPSLLHSLSPPSLLHLYWALHAINLLLAAIALVAYLLERHIGSVGRNLATTPTPGEDRQTLDFRPSTLDLMARLAPWLLLGLLFWIPGVYLEFPADPWEHYARINQWSLLHTVGEHTVWAKSSYFFAYSLLGQISPPTRQLFWLNFYYTGCCLLLCWQYYRLARSIGIGERASFIFVLIQALTFGNNIFGFYRYYGISSSIFAQLGAVALIRIALEVANGPLALRFKLKALSAALCAACLLPLIAFNHIQGLGIAGLGISAVVVWRLIEWRRSMVFWIAAAAVALSVAAILWWPRHPALDELYRPQRWLTSWYGFNIFSLSSPAFDRILQILGFFGVLNLIAGIVLLRRNHLAGWLTITPLFALCLPFIAIPFANSIAQRFVPEILTFHRMLLAIPAGLAVVVLVSAMTKATEHGKRRMKEGSLVSRRPALSSVAWGAKGEPFSLLLVSVTALTIVPAGGPYYNRFWHLLSVTPQDLQLKPVVAAAESAAIRLRDVEKLKLVSTPAIASVLGTVSPRRFPYSERHIGQPTTESLSDAVAVTLSNRPTMNSQWPTLVHDPSAADPSAWTTLDGPPPDFVAGVKDLRASSTALQNPPGQRSDVFTSDLIPIEPAQNYRVEWSVRQRIGTDATAYLAVAWYDEGGRLLVSNIPAPAGAGAPVGWVDGTYSYFGLVGTAAPTTWTTYRTSFGLNEAAAIPSRARFVRVGALLNYNSTPIATIQLTNVRLWRKSRTEMVANGAFSSDEHLFIVAPSGRMAWTCASQAAQMSHHWPVQQVAVDLAGGAELAAAARKAGGKEIESAAGTYYLIGNWNAAVRQDR